MYSTRNEGRSVVTKKFNNTLRIKIYKHVASISKNMHIDKLDDTVNKYNYIYNRTIKMKPVNTKSSKYIDFNVEKMKEILILELVVM